MLAERVEGEWKVTSERVWTSDPVRLRRLRERRASGNRRKGAARARPEQEWPTVPAGALLAANALSSPRPFLGSRQGVSAYKSRSFQTRMSMSQNNRDA